MRPGARASEQRLTAVTPPKRLLSSVTSRIGAPSAPAGTGRVASRVSGADERRSDIAGEPIPLLQDPEDPARHEEHDQDDDRAEEDLVEGQESRPDKLLEDKQRRRPEDRPPDRP